MCGKTTAALFALVNHAWHVRDASISLVSPTVTAGDDQGCWTELTENVIPKWIAGNFGLEWIMNPRQKGTTKKLYCTVKNKFGGSSKFQLDSLQYEEEAEKRFKNKSHSALYISEASYYKKRSTFDNFRMCLRGEKWTDDHLLLLLDTNPAEEGEDHWIWKLFYNERVQADVSDETRVFQKQLKLLEFTIDDNPYLPKDKKDQLKAAYAHSEDLTARYWFGKWVKAVGNSIFSEQFRPLIHIVGEYESPTNPEPETLLPQENCQELISGWDVGTSNSAFSLMEKFYVNNHFGKPVSMFSFLDEVVVIGSDISMSDFIQMCLDKVDFWEGIIGKPVFLRNWSDRSAFDNRDSISNKFHHQIVAMETDNRIILQAADRSPGSVLQRVNIMKKLLFENRIRISRSRCPYLIDSLQSLKAGKGNVAVDRTSKHKHVFDSSTYALASECYSELMRPRDFNEGKARVSRLQSVPL